MSVCRVNCATALSTLSLIISFAASLVWQLQRLPIAIAMVKIFTEKDRSFILYLDLVKNAIIKIICSNSLGNTVFRVQR